MRGKTIFEETQRFRYTWSYWLLVVCATAMVSGALFGIYQQLVLGEAFGSKPMSDTGISLVSGLVMALMIGMVVLFHFMVLKVSIDQSQIYYSFWPLVRSTRSLGRSDIDTMKLRKYSAIWDYGGWGYRWRPGSGRALNVKGNKGLQLVLKDGSKLLIGTQKETELERAIQTLQDNWKATHG